MRKCARTNCKNPCAEGHASLCEKHLKVFHAFSRKYGEVSRQEKNKAAMAEYRRSHMEKGLCTQCSNPVVPGHVRCNEHLAKSKVKYQEKKRKAIAALGGECACCGETELVYLQIDLVNEDGKEEGKDTRVNVLSRYNRIIEGREPRELQVLCANCRQAKTILGGCPRPHRI